MFHLQPRIHLQEIEFFLLINQKFNGARIRVSSGLGDAHRDLAHPAPHVSVNDRGRGFFDHLLMAALQRTFALAQIDGLSVLVGQHLHLDVAWIEDRLLDINFAIAKRALRLAARPFERRL